MPDFQRDITLTGGSNDLFTAPGSYDYWLYNPPTNGSVTISKAGKAPILISGGEVFVIYLQKGEEIALSGTAGNTLSILDHADVKLIPAARDVLGAVLIADPTTTSNKAAVLTAAPGAGVAGLVTRNIPSGTQTVAGPIVVSSITTNPTVNQGTKAALAQNWPVQLSDGVNVPVIGAAGQGAVGGLYVHQDTTEPFSVTIGAVVVTNPVGTNVTLKANSFKITTNGTTTVVATLAFISSIAIQTDVAGTGSTVTIQDKSGTPLKLINGLATAGLSTAPTVVSSPNGFQMIGGIDIVTAGAVAATIDVWVTYWS